MFKLKKMTVLSWDEESSIDTLPLDSQIFNFKGYFLGRAWNAEVFQALFDDADTSTGQCHGSLLIGGTVVQVRGRFRVSKTNLYFLDSIDITYSSENQSVTYCKNDNDGSAATLSVGGSNKDSDLKQLDADESSDKKISSDVSNEGDNINSSAHENNGMPSTLHHNTIVFKDTRTNDIRLMLLNNLDKILNVDKKHFLVHTKEEFMNDELRNFPYIYIENNKYKILISEDKTLGCCSELGAKLLVALHDDRTSCKLIESCLDTLYANGLYQDLKYASEINDISEDKSLLALQHIGFNYGNDASIMRTNRM